ncbi:MAG TPA: aldo/keto reductase [Variovorax sp.]|nr:aldo/keto reductase [Variovorax sp.]
MDLYQLHAFDPLTPVEETIRFLDDAVRAGKIHYVGLSNFLGWQVQPFVSTARQMGAVLPVTLQQQYRLLSRESDREAIPAAAHNGLGLLPWSPLAGGFLAGKYQRGTEPAADTRAGSSSPLYQWVSAEYAVSDRNWATVDAVARITEETGATPSQIALAWLADRPGMTAPIFGARTLAHLKDNLGAGHLHLDAQATAALEEVSRRQCGGYPYGAFGDGQRESATRWQGQANRCRCAGKQCAIGSRLIRPRAHGDETAPTAAGPPSVRSTSGWRCSSTISSRRH